VPIGIFHIVNYIRNRQIYKAKGGVECVSMFYIVYELKNRQVHER